MYLRGKKMLLKIGIALLMFLRSFKTLFLFEIHVLCIAYMH